VTRRTLAAVVVALAALAARSVTPEVRADEAVARAALAAAEVSLGKKEWRVAQDQFRRALEEDATLLEARCGLGHALAGDGRTDEAVTEFRAALVALELIAPLPAERIALYTRTQKRLGELSKGDASLFALMRKQADALVSLGQKFATKDPEASERALRAAVRLAPDHEKANSLLSQSTGQARGKAVSLLTGKEAGMWSHLNPPNWTFENGVITGRITDTAMLVRNNRRWSGDFDVFIEARLVEEFAKAGPASFAVLPAWTDQRQTHWLGFLRGNVLWQDVAGPEESDEREFLYQKCAEVAGGVDPTVWTTYEVRFRGDTVSAYVNGKEIGFAKRPVGRDAGYVCLKVQFCHVEFRRVEVTPR
jgi:tetratricopeptide (TPR) repeat protein